MEEVGGAVGRGAPRGGVLAGHLGTVLRESGVGRERAWSGGALSGDCGEGGGGHGVHAAVLGPGHPGLAGQLLQPEPLGLLNTEHTEHKEQN